MKDYKKDDIVFTARDFRWWSYDAEKYVDVEKNEKFKIIWFLDKTSNKNCYVDIQNVWYKYSVTMTIETFRNAFSIKEERRKKLLKIQNL